MFRRVELRAAASSVLLIAVCPVAAQVPSGFPPCLATGEAVLKASVGEDGDTFGYSVALSVDTTVVGAPYEDDNGDWSGSAYVFVRAGTTWSEQQKLTASDGSSDQRFGWSVAAFRDTVVVGTYDSTGTDAGSAYVFERSGTQWSEQQKLTASDGEPGDDFGNALASRDDTVIVGAESDDHAAGSSAGSAYVCTGASNNHQFGASIPCADNTAVVGTDASPNTPDKDSAYVFRLTTAGVYCTAGTSASGCQALLSACGVPSASAASGFSLQAGTVEGQKDGLFFFGTGGRQANSWGNGTSYQCVVPPVVRAGTLSGSGTLGMCDGSFARDLNALWCPSCPKPAKNPGAGATVQAQLWYRDPLSTSNQTTSLSDAIEVVVGL